MKTPTFGRSCPIRPEQGARRSLVKRQPTKTGRSAPARPVIGPERKRQSEGPVHELHQAPAGRRTSAAAGSKRRGLARARRRKPAAVATEGSLRGPPDARKFFAD